jgi:hypothetical protein
MKRVITKVDVVFNASENDWVLPDRSHSNNPRYIACGNIVNALWQLKPKDKAQGTLVFRNYPTKHSFRVSRLAEGRTGLIGERILVDNIPDSILTYGRFCNYLMAKNPTFVGFERKGHAAQRVPNAREAWRELWN